MENINPFRPLLHCHNNFIAIKTVWQCKQKDHNVHTVMCYQKTITKTHRAIRLSHWPWPVTCAWTPVKCLLIWYWLKVSKFALQLHWCFVGGPSQLARTSICSTCKSFHAPPFMLLIVLYNFVCYNYYAMVGWLVQEAWQKRGCIGIKSAL